MGALLVPKTSKTWRFHFTVFLVGCALIKLAVILLHHRNDASLPRSTPIPAQWQDQLLLIQPSFPVDNPQRAQEIKTVHQKNDHIFTNVMHPNERNFAKLLDLAQEDKINIIANGDIFFDDTIKKVLNMPRNVCYALSRWELYGEGELLNREDSQDVWIFRGKLQLLPGFADFNMGVPGCDNRLAWELEKSGYAVINPSKTIKTWHFHYSGYRTYVAADGWTLNHALRVPRPYLFVAPTVLMQEEGKGGAVKESGMQMRRLLYDQRT